MPPAGLTTRCQAIWKASTNDPIEVIALRGCAQQALVHCRGNAVILINCLITEFQPQHHLGFIVSNRRKCGRCYGGNVHKVTSWEAAALKQNTTKMY